MILIYDVLLGKTFVPTCQVRDSRFYCTLLLILLLYEDSNIDVSTIMSFPLIFSHIYRWFFWALTLHFQGFPCQPCQPWHRDALSFPGPRRARSTSFVAFPTRCHRRETCAGGLRWLRSPGRGWGRRQNLARAASRWTRGWNAGKRSEHVEETFGFVWKCWVYSQWNSHLIGIMISKTIGFRGLAYFQTHPHVEETFRKSMGKRWDIGECWNISRKMWGNWPI